MITIKESKKIEDGKYYFARFNGHALSARNADVYPRAYVGKVFSSGITALIELDLIQGKLIPSSNYEDSRFFFVSGELSETDAKQVLLNSPISASISETSYRNLFLEIEEALTPIVNSAIVSNKLLNVYKKLQLINS